jgi:hypothetical protein
MPEPVTQPLQLRLSERIALADSGTAPLEGAAEAAADGDTGPAIPVPLPAPTLRGFVQTEAAYSVARPRYWSKIMTRAQITADGAFAERARWRLSGRLDYDAVYDLFDHFPPPVRRDQRFNFYARENYIDFSGDNWDLRLGRQHVVWGEVVGLFFADVVSARDMREFILPEFEIMRIPQWAARAEYGTGNFHAELLWIPVPSFDKIGVPGAEFFPGLPPSPPGLGAVFAGHSTPPRTLGNTNYGLRLATLRQGWDLSGFYYRSTDAAPTFYRTLIPGPQPVFAYEARHDRIHQFGATLAKATGPAVLKAEAVHTRGRSFNVFRVAEPDGLARQHTLDWLAGVDFVLPRETRLNLQFFQRVFFDHDPDILTRPRESGYSVLLASRLADRMEGQVLWISSLARTDWLLRPRVSWAFEKNWNLALGADIFNGPPFGLFGRFANRDRIYAEVRYSF